MDRTAGTEFVALDDAPALSREALVSLLGGKGASLVTMRAMGLPVPDGFILTTQACRSYLTHGWSDGHAATVRDGVKHLEGKVDKLLGDADRPLLISVRSGAPISMPGMMDTVLNVGMNDAAEGGLARQTGDAAFAADTHRRALESYSHVVLQISEADYPQNAAQLSPADLRSELAARGFAVPQDPMAQVLGAVQAVFASWNSERAKHYRQIEGLDDGHATAVIVQAMVFGNLGADSGSGVAFSRDPATGSAGIMGDVLRSAQGEDVVSGAHKPLRLREMESMWPVVWTDLVRVTRILECDQRDLVDIEFTVEEGSLWLLQVRRGKRSALAAFRIAVEMADDPDFPLTRAEAVERCLPHLASPPLVASNNGDRPEAVVVLASGLGASPGRAIGVLCTSVAEAVRLEAEGVDVVLVRRETAPADIQGIAASVGLVTTLGGRVSHAAVVTRAWGKVAVVGAADLALVDGGIDSAHGFVKEGTLVTVDGTDGRLLLGAHPLDGALPATVLTIREWQAELATQNHSLSGQTSSEDRTATSETLDFHLLHLLRIKGMASNSTLSAITGQSLEACLEHLRENASLGFVQYVEARELWRLLPTGRDHHAELLTKELAGRDLSSLRYLDFMELNGECKIICTDWQLRAGELNDHSDETYDQQIRSRLRALHDRARPVVRSFAAILPWTQRYAARLDAALARVEGGDEKAVTGVMCDSYHDIWMDLLEDLILTQGIDRAEEGSG